MTNSPHAWRVIDDGLFTKQWLVPYGLIRKGDHSLYRVITESGIAYVLLRSDFFIASEAV